MKKKRLTKIKVAGQLDSLTDMLKSFLYQQPAQMIPDLVARVQKRMVTNQTAVKLEKHVHRCLTKNPSFQQEASAGWFLNTRGQRANDQIYQWLCNVGQPLHIGKMREMAQERGVDPSLLSEKELVADGRFLRLRDGRWVLVHWEVCRIVNSREVEKMVLLLRQRLRPVAAEELARKVLGAGLEGTDLISCLQEDPRFIWVGGHHWYLKELLPASPDPGILNESFDHFREAETAVLNEAELMLILNDTDPSSRDYIVSSTDLLLGAIRVTKRMERVFTGLPPVGWISFRVAEGLLEAWYLRSANLIVGMGSWYRKQDLAPGSKITVRRETGEERVFELAASGEREVEVFTEGQRVLQLELLGHRHHLEPLPADQLVMEVVRLFPSGISEGELDRLIRGMDQQAGVEVPGVLERHPFYERAADGRWRFNQAVQVAYERLARELYKVRDELQEAYRQSAAASQEMHSLLVEKEGLQGELVYLQNHHRDQEAQLQESVRHLKEQKEALERDINRGKGEMEKAYRRKELLQQELEPARQQIVSLRAEREALKGRMEQLEAKNIQLQSSLNHLLEDAQAEQVRLSQRVKEIESRLHQSLVANDDLQRAVVKLQEERRELKRRLNHWLVRSAVSFVAFFRRKGKPA